MFVFLSKWISVIIKMNIGKRQLLVLRGMCLSLRDSGRLATADAGGSATLIRDICVSVKMTEYLSVEEKIGKFKQNHGFVPRLRTW